MQPMIDEMERWNSQVPMTNGAIEVRGLVPEDAPSA
jgi:hypothetical protein